MFVIIHDMGNFEDACYHITDNWEVAVKVGADICMDLLNDLEKEEEWLKEQMEGCFAGKQYEAVIELWNDYVLEKDSLFPTKHELDKVYVVTGHYHKG